MSADYMDMADSYRFPSDCTELHSSNWKDGTCRSTRKGDYILLDRGWTLPPNVSFLHHSYPMSSLPLAISVIFISEHPTFQTRSISSHMDIGVHECTEQITTLYLPIDPLHPVSSIPLTPIHLFALLCFAPRIARSRGRSVWSCG